MAQDQLRAHRREARDHNFSQQPFDVEFFGITHAAMGHDGLGAGLAHLIAYRLLFRCRGEIHQAMLLQLA